MFRNNRLSITCWRPIRLAAVVVWASCLLVPAGRVSSAADLVPRVDDPPAGQVDDGRVEGKVEERVGFGEKPGEKVEQDREATSTRKEPAKAIPAVDDTVAVEQPVPVKEDADEKEEVVKPQKGIVRQKAAVVAAGAAEAAEEVGQVLGDILGGLFGGGNRQMQAQIVNGQLEANALKQFEAQYGRHFDQILRTELHFIRVVCQPTRQQYEAIAADGRLVRTKVLNRFALIQQGMNQGLNQSSDSDTRQPFAEDLLLSVKRHLSPDQIASYERELEARNEAHKTVAVLVTAAKLDRKLVLNSDQRAQVTKLLEENWHESWGSAPMLMYGGQYFPDVPDAKLIPILTDNQKKVWKTVDQQSQAFWGFNVGMNQGIVLPEEEWADDLDDKAAAVVNPKVKNSNVEKPGATRNATAAASKESASVEGDSE